MDNIEQDNEEKTSIQKAIKIHVRKLNTVGVSKLKLDNIVKIVKKYVEGHPITPGSILQIVSYTMTLVKDIQGLTGPDKKNLVLYVIEEIIHNTEMSDEDKEVALFVLDHTVPDAIDLLVSAGKGIFKFTKAKCKKLCSCC